MQAIKPPTATGSLTSIGPGATHPANGGRARAARDKGLRDPGHGEGPAARDCEALPDAMDVQWLIRGDLRTCGGEDQTLRVSPA